jgi:ribosomal protein S18 acetylase RimI-like enzyme
MTPKRAVPRVVRVSRVSRAAARAAAVWIAGMQPWKGLGYRAVPLGRYLARMAGAGNVWGAAPPASRRGRAESPSAIAVATDGFLLGGFIALLAVRADAGGQGLGRALVDHVAARTAAKRRWLFVSCDADNGAALRFYRRLGFVRVGRMPDLVARGRTELLLRKRLLLRKAPGSTMKPAE